MPLDGYDDAFGQADYSPPEESGVSKSEKEKASRNEEPVTSAEEEPQTGKPQTGKDEDASIVGVRGRDGAAVEVSYPGGETYRSPPRRSEPKKKVGFTFRRSVADRLESFQSVLKLTGEEGPTAKGEIVEAALDLFLRDWETRGEESAAIRWLRGQGQ